jgi:hypothetical protein
MMGSRTIYTKWQQHKYLAVTMRIVLMLVLFVCMSDVLFAQNLFPQNPADYDRRSHRERLGLRGSAHVLTENTEYNTVVTTTFDLRGYIVEELKVEPSLWEDDTVKTYSRKARRRKYDEAGRLLEVSVFNVESDGLGKEAEIRTRKQSMKYDEQSKLIAVLEYSFNPFDSDSSLSSQITYHYDSVGRVEESLTMYMRLDDTTRLTTTYRYSVLPESMGEQAGWIKIIYEIGAIRQTIPGFGLIDSTGIQRKLIIGSEIQPFGESYFDARGNLLRSFYLHYKEGCLASDVFTYDSVGNLLSGVTSCHKNYDEYSRGEGQKLERSTYTYEFDSHGNWISQRIKKQSAIDGEYREETASEQVIERTITYYQEGK